MPPPALNLVLPFLAIALGLSGCTSLEERKQDYANAMNPWIGRPADDLVLALGPPSKDFTLSTGGRVFEYFHKRRVTSGGGSVTFMQQIFVPASGSRNGYWVSVPASQTMPIYSTDVSCRLLFRISPKNVVEGWSAEGNDCY